MATRSSILAWRIPGTEEPGGLPSDEDLREPLVRRQGSQVSMRVARGSASWLSSHGRGLMLKLKLQYFGHLMQRTDSFEKTLMLGKIEGGKRRGTTEHEMVGWHHRLNRHEFE